MEDITDDWLETLKKREIEDRERFLEVNKHWFMETDERATVYGKAIVKLADDKANLNKSVTITINTETNFQSGKLKPVSKRMRIERVEKDGTIILAEDPDAPWEVSITPEVIPPTMNYHGK